MLGLACGNGHTGMQPGPFARNTPDDARLDDCAACLHELVRERPKLLPAAEKAEGPTHATAGQPRDPDLARADTCLKEAKRGRDCPAEPVAHSFDHGFRLVELEIARRLE